MLKVSRNPDTKSLNKQLNIDTPAVHNYGYGYGYAINLKFVAVAVVLPLPLLWISYHMITQQLISLYIFIPVQIHKHIH